jgi:acyl-homoserine lactone acylase PvdQ
LEARPSRQQGHLDDLSLWSAAQGQLGRGLLGAIPGEGLHKDKNKIDKLAHFIEAPRLGKQAWEVMASPQRDWLQAYVDGFKDAAPAPGFSLAGCLVGLIKPPDLTPAHVLSAVVFMAHHEQASHQAFMKLLLLQLVQAGARPQSLAELFEPMLTGWADGDAANAIKKLTLGQLGHNLSAPTGAMASGGSNAWAIPGAYTASGAPMLCADPHLAVHELPGKFFEMQVRFPASADRWFGATIAGLPAFIVGRNQHLAWANTFGCGDNVDFFVEEVKAGGILPEPRSVTLGPSWAPWAQQTVTFHDTPQGPLTRWTTDGAELQPGRYLAHHWAGARDGSQVARTLAAYMALATQNEVSGAQQTMHPVSSYSFHMVYADTAGTVG